LIRKPCSLIVFLITLEHSRARAICSTWSSRRQGAEYPRRVGCFVLSFLGSFSGPTSLPARLLIWSDGGYEGRQIPSEVPALRNQIGKHLLRIYVFIVSWYL
jgi:hypothetical protein